MFQSTHPCGVRRASTAMTSPKAGFNPRTRVGCDDQANDVAQQNIVSIHAPVWGATRGDWQLYGIRCFNPRTRVGCDDTITVKGKSADMFQSTHPCGVRRQRTYKRAVLNVSIHAPVWGATTPIWSRSEPVAFQSTHPCGVRRHNLQKHGLGSVSIHAPVWGATLGAVKRALLAMFQSTHPCGVRQGVNVDFSTRLEFQSTHPCGVRPHVKNVLCQ